MIGYYAHHHGRGHLARAAAIAEAFEGEVTILSSADLVGLDGPAVSLPLDTDQEDPRETGVAELHFAPIGSAGLSARMAKIASWIAESRPSLMVVDVSVEVALLSRLCGVPFVFVRQTGVRNDPPHLTAYRWAHGLLAPCFGRQEMPGTPGWVRAKTAYVGAVTRFDGSSRPAPPGPDVPARALLIGSEEGRWRPVVERFAAETVGWRIRAGHGRELTLRDFEDVAVVIGPAGNNLVAETAFSQRGLVCLPEERPFGEQEARAALLREDGAAEVIRPESRPADLGGLLRSALDKAPVLSSWADGRGAFRAADALRTWARSSLPVS